MDLSFYALHRISEKESGILNSNGMERKPIIPDGRALSDEQLVEKLESFGIEISKESFQQMVNRFHSAEEIHKWYSSQEHVQVKSRQDDWLWICMVVLWERWSPEHPSFEMIDELMQNGYDEQGEDNVEVACEMWLKTWKWIINIIDKKNLKGLDDFDQRFRGTQGVWNWVQDFELELGNAGYADPKFFNVRIEFTGDFLKRFPKENKGVRRNMKRALAESYFGLGDKKKAESLYEEWLKQDPQWGWGWIGYSDYYWIDCTKNRDFEKAEKILKRGLAVPQVAERDYLIDRLVNLYKDSGRPEEARKWLDCKSRPAPGSKISKVKSVIPSKKKRKKKKKHGK